MTKREQIIINDYCESVHDLMLTMLYTRDIVKTSPLYCCNAKIIELDNGWTFLQSYKTIVAFITSDGDFIDVLRLVYGYTSTSALHIAKFRNLYRNKIKTESRFYRI